MTRVPRPLRTSLALAVITLALPASAHADLILNGGFEEPALGAGENYRSVFAGHAPEELTGWTVTDGVDILGSYWQAAYGSQSLDLNGTPGRGTIKQAIGTTKGRRYQLSYSMSSNSDPGCGNETAPKTLDVLWDGVAIEHAVFQPDDYTRPDNPQWQGHILTVDSVTDGTELALQTTTEHDYCGPMIDNVVVEDKGLTPAPGPGGPPPGPKPSVPSEYRVQAIEVTQGAQFMFLGSGIGNMGNGGGAVFQPGSKTNTYSGVKLARGGETAVRVYVEGNVYVYPKLIVRNASTGAALATLESPVSPGYVDESAASAARKQQQTNGAFNFFLPENLANAPIKLEAQLQPGDSTKVCTTVECGPATLAGVSFAPVRPFTIRVVHMLTKPGQTKVEGDPIGEINQALRTVPHEKGALKVIDTNQTLDVSATAKDTQVCFLGFCHPRTSDEARDEAFSKLHWWDWTKTPAAEMTIGVSNEDWGVANGVHMRSKIAGCRDGVLWLCNRAVALVTVNGGRPRTSIGHELLHALGRPHASTACEGGANGQKGEDWLPDQRGRLNGVGFDFDVQQGPGVRRVVPSAVFPAGQEPTVGQYAAVPQAQWSYDLMSYCAPNGAGDPQAWVSPHNWNEVFDFLAKGLRGRPARARAAGGGRLGAHAHPAASADRLQILGFRTASGKVAITDVVPGTGPVVSGPAGGPHVVVYDDDGDVVSNTPMVVNSSHADKETPTPVEILGAQVPGGEAARVAIVEGKKVVGEERASKHAPRGRLVGIRRGAQLGKKAITTIRWRASDADRRDRLTILLEARVGGAWRRVYAGPDPRRHRTKLPQSAFPAGRGRLRLTVSDGLRFKRVVSPPVRFKGTAP
jgi:hypothetical protein